MSVATIKSIESKDSMDFLFASSKLLIAPFYAIMMHIKGVTMNRLEINKSDLKYNIEKIFEKTTVKNQLTRRVFCGILY